MKPRRKKPYSCLKCEAAVDIMFNNEKVLGKQAYIIPQLKAVCTVCGHEWALTEEERYET